MCIHAMARAVAALPPDKWGVGAVYDALRGELYKFHEQYIFKHPRYPYGDAPQVNLIVGTWCAEEKRLNLYESSEAALVEVSDIEQLAITGAGSAICRYIARPLIPGQYMALADVLTIAVYSLREPKTTFLVAAKLPNLSHSATTANLAVLVGFTQPTLKNSPTLSLLEFVISLLRRVTSAHRMSN
jgi:hypothetical protein